jgi:triacylglycerol lipase
MSTTTHPKPDLDTLLGQAEPDVLERLRAIGDLSINADNLAAMRDQPIRVQRPLSDAVERTDHRVPGPDGAPDVIVRVHRPSGTNEMLPCVYSMHGGGYVMGSHLGNDSRFDSWCPRLRCVGVSVDYRLAPETAFPGPLEDCYSGLRWVHAHAGELGIDASRIGVMGGSAGGGLAAGLALLARDRTEIPLAFQLLTYPMLDDRQATPSSRVEAPIWSPDNNRFAWTAYLGHAYGTDDISPYAAATRATDLTGLPPAFVMVGDLDGLLDEDIAYARRLIAAGVPTDLHIVAGAPHAFDSMMPDTGVARRALHTVESWLRTRLHPAREVG